MMLGASALRALKPSAVARAAAASSSSSAAASASSSSSASASASTSVRALRASLAAERASVLGTTYNPTQTRTGAKYLRARLVGPSMLGYYRPTLNLRAAAASVEGGLMPPDEPLMMPNEAQRLQDVERRKQMGKGPPKKGEGRRAAMKGKKGR